MKNTNPNVWYTYQAKCTQCKSSQYAVRWEDARDKGTRHAFKARHIVEMRYSGIDDVCIERIYPDELVKGAIELPLF